MNFEKSEYEIQHFTFSIEQMMLENRLMVKSNIRQLTEDFVDSLVKKSNISTECADTVRSKTSDVTNKIFKTFEGVFGEFDTLMEKYFSIPENILLAEDTRHEITYATADEEYYKEKVAEQEKTFEQDAYILTALGAELEQYEQLKSVIDQENKIIEKVEQSFKLKLNIDQANEIVNMTQEVLDAKNGCLEKNFKSKVSIL